MFRMSLSEREYVNWLKTNTWLIELAELPNPPDRRSIKRVFERTPGEYKGKLEEEIQKIIPDSKVYGVDSTGLKQSKRTGAWSEKKNRRKDFKKLHIIADLVNRAIVVQKLTEGRRHDSPVFGMWQTNWLVHDTEYREYVTTIVATNSAGDNSSYEVKWSDDPDPGWYNPNWNYRKNITINYTKVDAALTNFPVLINVTDSDLATDAQDDGDDILFTASDGTTKLSHEIELFNQTYNTTHAHLVAWVNVTSLSNTTDTVLYMYYNNSKCGSQQMLLVPGIPNITKNTKFCYECYRRLS